METSVALILGLLGVLGGGGVWTYLQSRKEAPVKKKDADMAAADKSVQMALSVATAARDDSAALRVDLIAERAARLELSGRVSQLSDELRDQRRTATLLQVAVRKFDAAWDEVTRNWGTLRLSETAPIKPTVTVD